MGAGVDIEGRGVKAESRNERGYRGVAAGANRPEFLYRDSSDGVVRVGSESELGRLWARGKLLIECRSLAVRDKMSVGRELCGRR